MAKKYDVLVLRPQDKPIYFVVKGRNFTDIDHAEYFYEEHVCPNDLFHDLEVVIVDGDTDAHGLVEYVKTIETPNDYPYDEDLTRLLPEAFPTSPATEK